MVGSRIARAVMCCVPLNRDELISLPEPKTSPRAPLYTKWSAVESVKGSVEQTISMLPGALRIQLAKGGSNEQLWNTLVQRYHYLGHKVSVGKTLKFLVLAGDTTVAAVSLTESAWAVHVRDRILDELGISRLEVANNNRFLILPHVCVPNLASRTLALLARDAVRQWEEYYSVPLSCLETFVDPERFAGTCYRAANWRFVGRTSGYGRRAHGT